MAEKKKTASQEYFDANPTKKEIFGTTDGFLFEDKYFAKLHGDTLPDGKTEVKTYANGALVETDVDPEE